MIVVNSSSEMGITSISSSLSFAIRVAMVGVGVCFIATSTSNSSFEYCVLPKKGMTKGYLYLMRGSVLCCLV